MSKQITSPVARWAGTVTIADPLTIPQAQLIEAGLKQPEGHEDEERIWLSVIDVMKLPAVIACVEKWELADFTPDPFPASPRGDSHKLIDFIFAELLKVYFGEQIVPNE
jgi:hypothetical protein